MILMLILFVLAWLLFLGSIHIILADERAPEPTVPDEIPDYAWGYLNGKSDAENRLTWREGADKRDVKYREGYEAGWHSVDERRARERKS